MIGRDVGTGSAQAEEPGDEEDDDNEADKVDDAVHDDFLSLKLISERDRAIVQRTINSTLAYNNYKKISGKGRKLRMWLASQSCISTMIPVYVYVESV